MPRTRPGNAAPIRIDPDTGWAWRGDQRLDLTPKEFAVLRYLVERPQHLVTKRDLLDAAWPGTAVSESALTSCIRDLRRSLDDSSRTPRYIETVHRRGFRFIGPVEAPRFDAPQWTPTSAKPLPRPTMVGRDAELARLQASLATAIGGQRQLVFVTGEPGIGKTTLVEAFLESLGDTTALRIGRGQCVEQYGSGEAYLPVLEALGRMAREPAGEALVRVLRQHAPTWLVQLHSLLDDEELEAVQRRAQGATRERMLRELSEAFDALGAEAPLVLLLEDLHWSDAATIDLLAMLARRRDRARLLIIGTYRPADVAAREHPLKAVKQELQLHGHCDELALEFLDETATREYLARRFPQASFPRKLARLLHEHTSGSPLFLVSVVDDLTAQQHVREVDGLWQLAVPIEQIALGVPSTLWQMVEKQIERLTAEEQTVLAVASVAGVEFSSALSTADGVTAEAGERCCAALARRGLFLRAAGTADWPDGTVASRYAFLHTLYRSVLYERIGAGKRATLHLAVGERLERAHAQHASDMAGELAMHFELGRNIERAIDYQTQAAQTALRQHGYREAIGHATRALALLARSPESTQRNQRELAIQTVLGAAVIATSGWAAPEVATSYARARELCAEIGLTPQLFPVLVGLCGFYLMRGELRIASDVSRQLLVHAQSTEDAAGLLGGHNTTGMALFYGGEFKAALEHFERASRVYDPARHSPNREFSVDHDPGVSCESHTALTLLLLGYPDRAAMHARRSLEYARSVDHPLSMAMACNFAATFYQIRREREAVQELEELRLEYATKHDFELFLLLGEIYRGWLTAEAGRREEALAQIDLGLTSFQAIGAELGRPTFLGILAEVYGSLGRFEEGLAVVRQALALGESTGLHYWDAELHRLKGTLTLSSPGAPAENQKEAESCFVEALEIARRQEAKFLELRAAISLGRLWQRQGKPEQAHGFLAPIFGWFDEGFEIPDLIEAKTMLGALDRGS